MRTKKEELLRTLRVERQCGLAKNVIIFVGDGMGTAITAASRIYKGQSEGRPGEETFLNFERFPNAGLMRVSQTR
jgi:alkaline phosphatase